MPEEAKQQDYYVDNLAGINEHNPVVTSEDIVNQQGALLVPAGQEVNADVARRVAVHKLAKPIEACIKLANSIDGEMIRTGLPQMTRHPEVAEIFGTELNRDNFKQECLHLKRYPLLVQKLTVMQARYPELFKKAVFGAFIALMVSDDMSLAEPDRHALFLATIGRDVGYLHIDPAVVSDTERSSAEEWRLLQGHVAVGYHVLKLMPNIPKTALQGVLEHHERVDGSGYPFGRTAEVLGVHGQVVGFADMLLALFYKYMFDQGFALQALEPLIQANTHQFPAAIGQAALRVIKRVVRPTALKHSAAEAPQLLQQLCRAHPLFNLLNNQCLELVASLEGHCPTKQLNPCKQALIGLKTFIASSGISDATILAWMEKLDPANLTDPDLREVEQYALLVSEGSWRLGELLRRLEPLAGKDAQGAPVQAVSQLASAHQTYESLTPAIV